MNPERSAPGSQTEEQVSNEPLRATLELISSHLNKRNPIPDILPGNQEEQDLLRNILETIISAQTHTLEISEGKLHSTISLRGIFGGALKNLQSNLRHLTWKTQMIAKGDFTHRVDFLYEFSEAFNSMIRELDETKKALALQNESLQEAITSLYISKEQYRTLILKSPVSICVLRKGTVVMTNPAFLELVHATSSDDVELQSFLKFVLPGNQTTFLHKMSRFSEYGVNWNRFEEELVCMDDAVIVTKIIGTDIVFENDSATLFFIDDITEKKEEETRILNSLQEKEILLKEVYHRVKNNMQIIWSLLSMQAKMVEDEKVKGYFTECQTRIKSLALVHEQLYKADNFRDIKYGHYLKQITTHLFNTYNLNAQNIHLRIEAGEETLSLAKAVPCSLIINELISNSLKYAFSPEKTGSITILFSSSNSPDQYVLDYRDTGPGLQSDIIPETSKTLGMKLIYGLTRQLRGTVFVENDNGVHYVITFPSNN